MKLNVVEVLAGTFNQNYVLVEVNNTGNKWVAKISRKLYLTPLDFIDFDDRAILAYRLAKHIEIKVPEAKFIDEKEIHPSPLRATMLETASDNAYIYDSSKILITKYRGKALPQFIEKNGFGKISNTDELIRLLVFNLWIGNYDKKDEDYVIMNSGVGYSIDYTLWGPGFRDDNLSSIGYYAKKFSLDRTSDVSFTIGEIFRKKVMNDGLGPDFFEADIIKIESLTREEIRTQFEGLTFYRETSHEVINELFIDFLVERKDNIRRAITDWCNEGYPKTIF